MLAVVRERPGFLEKPGAVVRGDAARLPWAWDGLCFGVPVIDASRDSARDVVNDIAGSMGANFDSSRFVKDPRGSAAVRFNKADEVYFDYADNPRHDRPSTALTVSARFRWRGASDAGGGIIENVYVFQVAPWCTWSIQMSDVQDASDMYGALTVGGTNTEIVTAGYATPTTDYVTAFLRWRSGEAARFDIYGDDGRSLNATTSGVLTGTLSYNAGQGIRINANESPNNNVDMDFSQAMVWSRRLGDAEVKALVQDPFGWYAPRRSTVTVAAPFPVGPGLAAPGMTHAGFGFR